MISHSMIEHHFKEFLYSYVSHTAHVLMLFVLFLSSKHCIQHCLGYVQLHFSLGFQLLSLCFKQQFSQHFTLFCSNRMKLPIILLCEQKVDSSTLTECSSIFHLLLWCIPVTCCWPCIGCSSASSQVQRLLYMIQSL